MEGKKEIKEECNIKEIPYLYSQRLSRPGYNGCCGFFRLFGHVLKVVFPNVSPVSVAGIFTGQHSVLCSGVLCLGVLWCSLFG